MANPTATVTDFCGVLTRSRLLPASEVAAACTAWKADPAVAGDDVEGFRKYLVAKRFLTEYQAALIQRGHADGFYVGGYVILDKIGKGRSAGVYKAVHASGQVVALKVLPASRAKVPQALARFQREGRLLTQLTHPNVVRAYQLGTTDGRHFIVMEHLEGETLDDALARRKQLPPPEATRVVFQALQGLQHLHEQRMVHRDLKPANLMATPAPAQGQSDTTLAATIKILDIGLGRELFDEDASATQDLQLTSEGVVLGTPDYLAPEQGRDARAADVRADIYSLGCVLYHLLAGQPPFSEKIVMAALVRHATEPVPPIAQFAPAVVPGLARVLEKMLAKDPVKRYATPGEAAEALRPYLPVDAPPASESKLLQGYEEWLESESSMELPAEVIAAIPAMPAKTESGPAALPRRSGTVAAPANAISKPVALPNRPHTAPEVPDSLPQFDVELVTLPGAAEPIAAGEEPRVVAAPPVRPLYDLDRRDFIMLAFGAGGVIAAILGGFLAARAMKNKVQGEQEEQKENQP